VGQQIDRPDCADHADWFRKKRQLSTEIIKSKWCGKVVREVKWGLLVSVTSFGGI
jgi:hypothetical protein